MKTPIYIPFGYDEIVPIFRLKTPGAANFGGIYNA